jgi:thymidylate synthase (FAD)
MYTMWIETGSLLYWARLVNLRKDTHAQVEIQTLASQINDIIEPLFPITWPYLMSNEL